MLSSQDVGPSVNRWRDSCHVPWWDLGLRRKRSIMPYYGSTKDLDASKAFEVDMNHTTSAYFVYLCNLSFLLLHHLFSSHQCGFLSQVMLLELGHDIDTSSMLIMLEKRATELRNRTMIFHTGHENPQMAYYKLPPSPSPQKRKSIYESITSCGCLIGGSLI